MNSRIQTPSLRTGPGPHVRFAPRDQPVTATAIAIVIVNYNSGGDLEQCLHALARQTRRAQRVIVVDNASTDDSWTCVDRRLPDCELVRQPTNIGFAAANNRAIELCRDVAWVALLNADAFPEPGWLAALDEAVQRYPDHSAFASLMVRANDPARLDGAGDAYHASGFAYRVGCGEPSATDLLTERDVFAACAAAALYRRAAFQEVGGFDESYFCYFEDVDLGVRLRLAGHRTRLVPEAVVRHVGSAVAGRHSDFTVYHAHRNLVWTWWKNLPGPLLVRYLPQHLLLQAISVAWFALRGQGRTILRAKWDALRRLPRVWRERSTSTVPRRVGPGEFRRLLSRGWLDPYTRGRD